MPLPLGLPCALAQPSLSPYPVAMPQAAVVAHLEPQHQQTTALSAAVSVSVQAQSATGAWQREGGPLWRGSRGCLAGVVVARV